MLKRLSRRQLLRVLASGVLIAAVAGGITGYLTLRDQVAGVEADLAALNTRLKAAAEQDAGDEEMAAAPLPSPFRWPDTDLRVTCDSSGFVQWADDHGSIMRWDKWLTAGQILDIESDRDADANDRGFAFWMRECAAALGLTIP